MSLWTDLVAEIISLTNRPDLTAETDLALRQAVRAAHKSGKYWRDLALVSVTGLSEDTLQDIPLSNFPQFRQAIYVKSGTGDKFYKAIAIDDLLDDYNVFKLNVYYGFGTSIKLRSSAPETSYDVAYYKYPIVSPTSSFDSWIADQHRDLLVALAASNVCGMVGEQEIKSRLDVLVNIGMQDLISDNIEIEGR